MDNIVIAHIGLHFQERDYGKIDKSGRARDIFLLDKRVDA
jgi:hypothetical protein